MAHVHGSAAVAGKGRTSLTSAIVTGKAGVTVIPCSEIADTKPPYMCPGCLIHTYNNNMINRCHV
jgi:hypothetical protein